MPKQKQRRLAAIMFTDIVGYSAMMQKNEALASRLRARHREVFQRLHKKYRGEIIQYFGDGTLSVFNSTADAVECAVELQRELKQTPQVPIRVGIHTGDITFSEEEVIGDGVNIAARIQSESVPGGIFISGKAQDDIKNHPELRTRAIGQSDLKNIKDPIDIYAVVSPGITIPDYEWVPPKQTQLSQVGDKKVTKRKKKWVASFLALFLGIFGIHRFYLEQRNLGIAYLTLFFVGAFFPGADQLAGIPALLGVVDFLIFLSTSRARFDEKYNQEFIQQEQHQRKVARAKANDPRNLLSKQREKYLQQAQDAHKDYDYQKTIRALNKAIEIKYDDPETHFFLARVYSLAEQAPRALQHLDIAVAFGLEVERIKTEGDLAFLRVQPEYLAFEQNNFHLPPEPVQVQEDYLDLQETNKPDLLGQLSRLEKEQLSKSEGLPEKMGQEQKSRNEDE
ncbi:MAG TPA: NINE protein [Saprospiraceae bacterium]|nr:NINE protein [Saprospiraceae bacterium]